MDIHIKLTVDDRIVNALRRVGTKRAAGATLGLMALCGSLVVFASPVAKPHTFEAAAPIRASEINENFDTLYEEFEARVVRADQTIQVESCNALRSALAAFDDRRIASSATVTFQLPEVTSSCMSSVIIDHPDGAHIRILGQGSAKTVLTFFGGNGFLIPMTRGIGLIDKMTISGTDVGGHGVMVEDGASARLGSDFTVRDFVDGVHTNGGWIRAAGVISEDNADDGFEASYGGIILANGAIARSNAVFGFNAYLGSAIVADGAEAQSNASHGFEASFGSTIQALDGASATGSRHGYNADGNSAIIAFGSTAASNTAFGYAASKDSLIDLVNPTTNDNATGFVAVAGSYMSITGASGNSNTVQAPGANTWNEAQRALVQQN
jgi:hypothetical protein